MLCCPWAALLSYFDLLGAAAAILYQFGSAGSRKTKMDTPHAAMKLEPFEGFRDRSVARATCRDGLNAC